MKGEPDRRADEHPDQQDGGAIQPGAGRSVKPAAAPGQEAAAGSCSPSGDLQARISGPH